MVCKVNSIFDEIFKILHVDKKKVVLQTLQRRYLKKMSGLDNLSKKGTSITLGEDELLPERMRSYPCLYDKICK